MAEGDGGFAGRVTRPQHERIFAIVRLIRDLRYPNAAVLAGELEVTRRTIMRDLDYLRDRMGMPIAYDRKLGGYYLDGEIDGVPLLEMRAADLLWLFVGQHFLRQVADEPLANQMRASFQRISGLFGSPVSVSWDQLSGLLSSKLTGVGEAEFQIFRVISEALARSRRIRFEYRKTASSPIELRIVEPLHCSLVNGQWYLFAHDLERAAIRTFVLARMSGATISDRVVSGGAGVKIPEMLAKGFGVRFAEGETQKVKIVVSGTIAHLIRERLWHPTQRVSEGPDDSILLELEVNAFTELANWICSWGPQMEVLEPVALRSRVAESHRLAAAVYETGK